MTIALALAVGPTPIAFWKRDHYRVIYKTMLLISTSLAVPLQSQFVEQAFIVPPFGLHLHV